VHNRSVVHGISLNVERERSAAMQRPCEIGPEFPQTQGCFFGRIRIAGIPDIVHVVVGDRTVEFVRAWLGKNLDATQPQAVVLGRERILIDADLADRIFRRELPAAESIYENRPAARARRGSGERLEIGPGPAAGPASAWRSACKSSGLSE